MRRIVVCLLLLLVTVSCARNAKKTVQIPSCDCTKVAGADTSPIRLPEPHKSEVLVEKPVPDSASVVEYSLLKQATWQEIDGFQEDNLQQAWNAWLQSCHALKSKTEWQVVCGFASGLTQPSNAEIRRYFQENFQPYLATNLDGTDTGLITGYYQPVLRGSRNKTAQYPYPLYRQPSDLVTVELGELYPELKYKRVRGKLVGNKLVPYYKRGEIEANPSPLSGEELIWVDDIIDLFFLQIQGSGLVRLNEGGQIQVGYADQNGHAYNSIGKQLIAQGELTPDQASMQGIKNWARNNLSKLRDLLNSNPSYVFFRELPLGLSGPLGALGVPIAAQRSIAVDPKFVPLGAPVFLSTTYPNTVTPLKQMMLAQDTGGAIKGGVRADFFWGAGDEAGKRAGAMKQSGKMWVILPKSFVLPVKQNAAPIETGRR